MSDARRSAPMLPEARTPATLAAASAAAGEPYGELLLDAIDAWFDRHGVVSARRPTAATGGERAAMARLRGYLVSALAGAILDRRVDESQRVDHAEDEARYQEELRAGRDPRD